jgi:hypothetical protein
LQAVAASATEVAAGLESLASLSVQAQAASGWMTVREALRWLQAL